MDFLDTHPQVQDILLNAVRDKAQPCIDDHIIDELRLKLHGIFDEFIDVRAQPEEEAYAPVDEFVSSCIDCRLLHRWAMAIGDPACHVAL